MYYSTNIGTVSSTYEDGDYFASIVFQENFPSVFKVNYVVVTCPEPILGQDSDLYLSNGDEPAEILIFSDSIDVSADATTAIFTEDDIYQSDLLWYLNDTVCLSSSVPFRNDYTVTVYYQPLYTWTGTANISSSVRQVTTTSNSYFPNKFIDSFYKCQYDGDDWYTSGLCSVSISSAFSSDVSYTLYSENTPIGQGVFKAGKKESYVGGLGNFVGNINNSLEIYDSAKITLQGKNAVTVVLSGSNNFPTGAVEVRIDYTISPKNHVKYYYNGEYKVCTMWRYNGTEFKECRPKYYNGSAWVDIN